MIFGVTMQTTLNYSAIYYLQVIWQTTSKDCKSFFFEVKGKHEKYILIEISYFILHVYF